MAGEIRINHFRVFLGLGRGQRHSLTLKLGQICHENFKENAKKIEKESIVSKPDNEGGMIIRKIIQ